jgi:uncharacterized repeat protein (TIGR02543 family)
LERVYSIGEREFENLRALKNVYVDPTLHFIGKEVFSGCINLKDIWFDGNQQQWNAVAKDANWKDGTSNLVEHWHCTVTFNANGHGTTPDPKTIQWTNLDKVDEPEPLVADGYNFLGWFTDAECTNQWDFNNVVPGDMTLYAKWEATEYAVNVSDAIEHGTVTADKQTAAQGETVTLTVTPDNGYQLEALTVMNGSTAVATTPSDVEGIYTFVMPGAPVTVNATFVEIPSVVLGDVNGDGEVTTVDITAIYNYLLNGDETFIATSDVDGDGYITSVDITFIYNILLGN